MSKGKKYSSFLKEQKIFDNWRGYLTEGFSGYAPSKFDPKVTRQGFVRPEYIGMNGYGGNPGYAEEDTIVDEEMEPVRAMMKKHLYQDVAQPGEQPKCMTVDHLVWPIEQGAAMMAKMPTGKYGKNYNLPSQYARKLANAALNKAGTGGQAQSHRCPPGMHFVPDIIDLHINNMTRLLLQDFEGWLESMIPEGPEYVMKDLGRNPIQDIIKELLNKEKQNE